MVRKFITYLSHEFSGLHQAALLLGLSSFASQLLALLRDRLLAQTFGASGKLDIYYAAFTIPDLIFVSVGSFLAVTVLIPLFIQKKEHGSKEEARKFMDGLLSFYLLPFVPQNYSILSQATQEQKIRSLLNPRTNLTGS